LLRWLPRRARAGKVGFIMMMSVLNIASVFFLSR